MPEFMASHLSEVANWAAGVYHLKRKATGSEQVHVGRREPRDRKQLRRRNGRLVARCQAVALLHNNGLADTAAGTGGQYADDLAMADPFGGDASAAADVGLGAVRSKVSAPEERG